MPLNQRIDRKHRQEITSKNTACPSGTSCASNKQKLWQAPNTHSSKKPIRFEKRKKPGINRRLLPNLPRYPNHQGRTNHGIRRTKMRVESAGRQTSHQHPKRTPRQILGTGSQRKKNRHGLPQPLSFAHLHQSSVKDHESTLYFVCALSFESKHIILFKKVPDTITEGK